MLRVGGDVCHDDQNDLKIIHNRFRPVRGLSKVFRFQLIYGIFGNILRKFGALTNFNAEGYRK